MKFDIPKTTRFLPLQDYDPENADLAGVGLHVWVDPPRSVLLEFDGINREYSQLLAKLAKKLGAGQHKTASQAERLLNFVQARVKFAADSRFRSETETYRRALYAWYARLWSQSPDAASHWTVDELEKINEDNPRLYEWLCASSWVLVERHREDVKKGFRGPSVRSPAPAAPATPSSLPTSSPSTLTSPPAES